MLSQPFLPFSSGDLPGCISFFLLIIFPFNSPACCVLPCALSDVCSALVSILVFSLSLFVPLSRLFFIIFINLFLVLSAVVRFGSFASVDRLFSIH